MSAIEETLERERFLFDKLKYLSLEIKYRVELQISN